MTPQQELDLARDNWHELALRHIGMAEALYNARYFDGTQFHVCHAIECILKAFIAAQGHLPPPDGAVQTASGVRGYLLPDGTSKTKTSEHQITLEFARQLLTKTYPYYSIYKTVTTIYSSRNQSLYYSVRLPQMSYTEIIGMNPSTMKSYIGQVKKFITQVWADIGPTPQPQPNDMVATDS